VMQAHVDARPRPILVARPDCPAVLQSAVFRMLAKEVSQRWPAMEDVIAAVGGPPLAHDDPIRFQLAELAGAKTGSTTPIPGPPPVSKSPVAHEAPIDDAAPSAWPRWLKWAAPAAVAGGAALWLIARFVLGPQASVASVTLQPHNPSISVGGAVSLQATLQATDGRVLSGRPVTWGSSDPSVATVDARGVVSGLGAGAATVTAAAGGQTGAAVVTVLPPRPPARDTSVVLIDVMPRGARVPVNATFALRALPRDSSGRVVRRTMAWESSDPAVATVSGTGVISGVAPGTATVTARSEGVQSAPVAVTVVPAGPSPPGILRMLIVPTWLYVSIDGLPRGQRTRAVDTLPSGVVHRLHFERDGFIPVDTTIKLRPGETRLLTIQVRPRTP
jgi:Big-like domain-containing protein